MCPVPQGERNPDNIQSFIPTETSLFNNKKPTNTNCWREVKKKVGIHQAGRTKLNVIGCIIRNIGSTVFGAWPITKNQDISASASLFWSFFLNLSLIKAPNFKEVQYQNGWMSLHFNLNIGQKEAIQVIFICNGVVAFI